MDVWKHDVDKILYCSLRFVDCILCALAKMLKSIRNMNTPLPAFAPVNCICDLRTNYFPKSTLIPSILTNVVWFVFTFCLISHITAMAMVILFGEKYIKLTTESLYYHWYLKNKGNFRA